MTPRNIWEGVTRHSAEPKNNSAVLQGAVRIPKPRANRSDFLSRGMTHHFREPSRFVDLGVVVQEQQNVTAGLDRRAVIEPAVVEWSGLDHNADDAITLSPAEEGERP